MKKVVISGMIGNGLEWYDYALYGQVIFILAKHFFPAGDETVQMLAAFGVFAAAFIVRPIGAAFFGWLGDKYGRQPAMVVAILMMALPTGAIGLLPTYAEIGIWAPIALTVIRLMQGMSLGGEFSGSIAYIVEHAPAKRRGIAGAASLVSLKLGFMLGIIVVRGVMEWVGEEAFQEWGWRIPFLLGIVIGLIGFYIRHYCDESPIYVEAKQAENLSPRPIREAFGSHPWKMAQGFGAYVSVTMPFYLMTVFFISFMTKHLHITMSHALDITLMNLSLMAVATAMSAHISDYFGRKKVMMTAAIMCSMTIYPMFAMMQQGMNVEYYMLVQGIFCFMLGCYMGPVATFLVELFPTPVRFSGMAISYNLAAALFGGTAPLVCEWLIGATGSYQSLAYYVMLCNLISLVALYYYRDRSGAPL
ncbi:MAG: MFS transporter [Alphaproteobacteria bacterium]|nr:MAG: MFS transporter [Alphaproteobacteria bacterium]